MKKIGIDLGTTNTVVTINDNDQIKIVPIDNDNLLPSVFYYNEKRKIKLVGKRAKNRGLMDPDNYIKSTKRSIDSPEKKFTASNKTFSSEDVAVEILLKVKEAIYQYLGHEEELEAVITVPNNFTTSAVENTKSAGIRAGFSKVETLKEPIASVLAYGEEIRPDNHAIYFVCDFGGGTLYIAVIRYDGNEYEVIATGGNEKLGGDDFTNAMINYLNNQIMEKEALDYSLDSIEDNVLLKTVYDSNVTYQRTKAKIAQKAEAAKVALSYETSVNVAIGELCVKNDQSVTFECAVTSEDFNQYSEVKRLWRDYKEAIEEVIEKLKREDIEVSDINHVIFVGGSMNLPEAKRIVQELIPANILEDNLDTIVAIGASSKMTTTKQITPRVNFNLGLKVEGDKISVIIPEQSKYPIEASKIYTTLEDNQTMISFEVYEGNIVDDVYDKKNHWLGKLDLSGIEMKEAGEPQIKVTFSLNQEGILKITALDLSNNHQVDTELNWQELKY